MHGLNHIALNIMTGPITPAGDGLLARRKVLWRTDDGYATHIECEQDGAWHRYWGHYFDGHDEDSLRAALEDYHRREP